MKSSFAMLGLSILTALTILVSGCDYFDPYSAAHLPAPPPLIARLSLIEIIQPENWPLLQAYLYEQAALGSEGTPTADTSTISAAAGAVKWHNGVLAPNGKIYGIPFSSASVLIIDPETDTADVSTLTGVSGANKYTGSCLAFNGLIYTIPRDATSVLIIDPRARGEFTENILLCSYYNNF